MNLFKKGRKKYRNIVLGIVFALVSLVPMISHSFLGDLETWGATNVTETTATMNAHFVQQNQNQGTPNPYYAYFRYSTTNPGSCNSTFGNPTPQQQAPIDGSFSQGLINLTPDTTYYYCAIVQDLPSNPDEEQFGQIVQFTTQTPYDPNFDPNGGAGNAPAPNPTIGPVRTFAPQNLDDTEAALVGGVTWTDGEAYAYFRLTEAEIPPLFCNEIYGSRMVGVTATSPNADGSVDSGYFYAHVTDLAPDTQYAYCAFVSNSAGKINPSPTEINYGKVEVFKTLPCDTCDQVKITTKNALVTSSTTATLRGSYDSTKAIRTYFEYRKTANDPGSLGTAGNAWIQTPVVQHNPNSYGNLAENISGLEPNTFYKFRAVGETDNPAETFYGNTLDFRTNKYDGAGGFTPPVGGGGTSGGGTSGGGSIIIDTGDDNCPYGTVGTFPNCIPTGDIDTAHCPPGQKGTPPNCYDPNNGNTGGPNNTFPSVIVTATPSIIDPGENSIIKWKSANADICSMAGHTNGGTAGSFNTGPLTQSRSYTITCTGPGGTTAGTAYVYVNYSGGGGGGSGGTGDPDGGDTLPTVTMNSVPVFGPIGTDFTVYWQSHNANACDAGLGLSGQFNTGPLNTGQAYTVLCWNDQGWASGTLDIYVYDPDNLGGTSGGGSSSGGGSGGSGGGGSSSGGGSGSSGGGSGGAGGGGSTIDTDGDGINDDDDADDDGDGIPDWLDPDSDNPDIDDDGIGDDEDPDLDGDGIINWLDPDTDGDGIPNDTDGDDDNDGIPDLVDSTPTGVGNGNDYDGGGLNNENDGDMDGDGIPNGLDPDTDGDGIPNSTDTDDDNDGIPDDQDSTPTGPDTGNPNNNGMLKIGDSAIPPDLTIVRWTEGVETVFARQIINNIEFARLYGYRDGEDLERFAQTMAHTFSKYFFGYVAPDGREIRVSQPDVSAYELRQVGGKLIVYEYYKNVIVDIRSRTTVFKLKNPYEYYFTKRIR